MKNTDDKPTTLKFRIIQDTEGRDTVLKDSVEIPRKFFRHCRTENEVEQYAIMVWLFYNDDDDSHYNNPRKYGFGAYLLDAE